MKNHTLVIFRAFKQGGDVIALFPLIPATDGGWRCQSYQHIGQHGAACPHICRNTTRPATRAEIAPLRRELTRLGYRLKTIKRFPSNAFAVRRAQLPNP